MKQTHVIYWLERKKLIRMLSSALLVIVIASFLTTLGHRAGAIADNVLDTLKQRSGSTNKVSPNSNLFILSNPNNDNIVAQDFWHVLRINKNSGSVMKIELNAYHNSEKAAKKAEYRITATDVCSFINIGGAHSLTVDVNGKEVASFDTNNSSKACNDFNNLSFKAPSNAGPDELPNTPYYFNNITFKLNGPNVGLSGDEHRVRFRVTGPDKTRFSFTSGSGPTEFGVVGGLVSPGLDASIGIPFGLSCSGPEIVENKQIKVYDPDPSFGNTYIFIMWRKRDDRGDWTKWSKIPDSGDDSYRFAKQNDAGTVTYHDLMDWQGNDTPTPVQRWKISGAGSSGDTAFITIKRMLKDHQYMLVYYNPFNTANSPDGGNNPANNLLSFSLPGQSIYGQIGCNEPDYRLTPHLDLHPNSKRTFTYYANDFAAKTRITKKPSTVPTDGSHTFRLTKAIFNARPTNLADLGESEEDTTQDPCARIGTTNLVSCATAATGTYDTQTETSYASHANQVVPVGYYVCLMASVQRPFSTGPAGEWSHSNMECAVSGIKPKIKVRGGDVKASGAIETATTDIIPTGRTYGSWGEYGVFSGGANGKMGSGAGLANTSIPTQNGWSSLTFSNMLPPFGVGYGNFGSVSIPTVDTSNATGFPWADGLLNQSRLNALPARATILRVGDLRILDNLTYPETTNSIDSLHKVIIVADRITIDPGVTRIDPWLVANQISTCSSVAGYQNLAYTLNLLHSNMCNAQISFNGPVITPHLYLYRTYDDVTGGAAETFNLRADNILSSYSGSSGVTTPVATTSTVKELPPRF